MLGYSSVELLINSATNEKSGENIKPVRFSSTLCYRVYEFE